MIIDFDPREHSIASIIFPKNSKSRVILEALLKELKASRERGMSRHALKDFADRLAKGSFIWHNMQFHCSQRQVYKIVATLRKLGMLRLEKRFQDKYERYYVSFTDFSKNLNLIVRKWEEEFQ